MSPKKKQGVVIYQAKSGAVALRGDFSRETVWATQAQIAQAFDVDVRTINEHITNVFRTNELTQGATLRNFRIVQKEGGREVVRDVKHYNLDLILSVGYRVNSKKATAFRQWATKTLRRYITRGYVIDKRRVARNYAEFAEAITAVRQLLPKGMQADNNDILELISIFADTWVSLDAYDRGALVAKGATKKSVSITAEKLQIGLDDLKRTLMRRGEASELFGAERSHGALGGIIGNVMQSFSGAELYQTVEEKAAHLLYFMVKDHPFVDGNKRSGAYSFVWFLRQAKLLDTGRLTPPALTAMTLLVAESEPQQKVKMIKLILTLLQGIGKR